jgi:drug/metabolite transporter (DMT)-like permease
VTSGASPPSPGFDPRTGRARGRAHMLASAVLFGLAAMLAKIAARAGMSGGQATLVRFSLGLAAVVALFRLRPGTFRPGRWGLLAVRGLVGGTAALLYYLAIARIPAGEATLLNNLFPIFAVVISLFTLKERPTIHLAVALLVASAGVYLVLCGGDEVAQGGGLSLHLGWGEGIALVSALAGGVAVTAIRALRTTVNAPTVFSSFAAGGILVSLPFGFARWPADPIAWAAALAAGVAAFFAQLSMTEAYGALSIPEAAVLQQLAPISAYLWALLLSERITSLTGLGVLLGVAGVVYGSLFGARPGADSPEASRIPVLPAEEP